VSILLEALRKSEKNQRQPAVPDIHADDESNRLSDTIQTGPLAVLLVLALFICGWLVWNQYQAPVAGDQAPETLAAGETTATSQTANDETAANIAAQTDPGSQHTAPNLLVKNADERSRTPVESYTNATSNNLKAGSGSAGKAAPGKDDQASNQTAVQSSSSPAPTKSSGNKQPVDAARNVGHHELAPISYWELPDAIRADLPDIRFSVLVYSKQPDHRFVLINGQRLAEGDSAQAGLVVEEIRRDGVIFSYRLYQFLVER